MATKICWQCRTEIDQFAAVCPGCRAKVGGRTASGLAKKPFSLVLGCLLGCGGLFLVGVLGTCVAVSWSVGRRRSEQGRAAVVAEQAHEAQLAAWRQLPAKDQLDAAEAFIKQDREIQARAKKYLEDSLKSENVKAPVDKLTTKQESDDMRARLGFITPNQPEYAKAQDLLKQMDDLEKKSAADYAAWEQKAKPVWRKDYAKDLEERFIERRMSTDVSASGKDNTILTIKYVLATKVVAHDLSTSGVIQEAEQKGFKKVRLTDGYEHSWEWDLTKKD